MRNAFLSRIATFVWSQSGRRILWTALGLAAAAALGAQSQGASSPTAVVYLNNGGFIRGDLRDSSNPAVLSWQGVDFVAPFDFDVNRIDAVYFPDPVKPAQPAGEYC